MAFTPTAPPVRADLEGIKLWVLDAFEDISNDLQLLERVELHVAPTRPYHGQEVIADGTDWNPGSGRGLYWYDGSTTTWKFIA